MEFLKSLKSDYDLWVKKPKLYSKNVENLSDLFNFKNNKRFESKLLPSGFSGIYNKKNQIVMFGLNPGLKRKLNQREELKQMKNWESYIKARKNLFIFFKELDHPSNYYKKFWLLFSNLVSDSMKYQTKWDFFNQNVTNLNLFPYHSKGFSLSKHLSDKEIDILEERLRSLLDFIIKYSPRIFIFNGKPWEILLINQGIVKNYKKVKINKNFSIYLFELQGIPSILFEKFFSRHFWLDDKERSIIIPKLIKKNFPNIFKQKI